MPRPMNRRAPTDMHATAQAIEQQQHQAFTDAAKRAREHRTPRTAVMPACLPGDTAVLVTGATVTIARVNAKSITSVGGVGYTAGEIQHVLPGEP